MSDFMEEVREIEIHPHPEKKCAIIVIGGMSIVCESADLNDEDCLILYMGGRSIAAIKTEGIAFGVPNMIRKAIIVNTSFTWES